MKFSKNWLQKWVDIPVDINELAEQLTSVGLEVEAVIDAHILDVAIPPNRGDCLSLRGIAQELAALYNQKVIEPTIEPVASEEQHKVGIAIEDVQLCPRYIGRVISNVNAAIESPKWMQDILKQAGMKPVLAIVDITNYVMLELGQPLHAFDFDKIHGSIHVRKAKAKEELTLLDGKEIKLSADDLVIADSKQVLALAGIMGGEASAVKARTKNIFIECAYFEPISVRLSARANNIQTDSSYRFERGVSPDFQALAIERVTQLILEIAGGKASPAIVEEDFKFLPQTNNIRLRLNRIASILGVLPSKEEIENILTRLGMDFSRNENEWQVQISSARQDITLEVDLIEEITRFFGLNNIPEIMPKVDINFKHRKEGVGTLPQMKLCLRDRGYTEVITYSFIEPKLAAMFNNKMPGLELLNPISADMSTMRPSLIPGLVKVLLHNQNRQHERVKVFETGLRFINEQDILISKKMQQKKTIAGLCAGKALAEQWNVTNRDLDFFDLKGDVEVILKLSNISGVKYVPLQDSHALHPGQSATLYQGELKLGVVGMLHPQVISELGLLAPVFVFELDLVNLSASSEVRKFKALSKFPLIKRDLNFVVVDSVTGEQVEEIVRKKAGKLLQSLNILDIYKGNGIDEGKKSITVSLILQHPSRTLIDNEVNETIDRVIGSLKKHLQATLRE